MVYFLASFVTIIMYGLMLVCTTMCFLKWFIYLQVVSKQKHIHGLVIVCLGTCCLKYFIFLQVLWQLLQMCGFTLVCTNMCCFKWFASLQMLWQWSHAFDLKQRFNQWTHVPLGYLSQSWQLMQNIYDQYVMLHFKKWTVQVNVYWPFKLQYHFETNVGILLIYLLNMFNIRN